MAHSVISASTSSSKKSKKQIQEAWKPNPTVEPLVSYETVDPKFEYLDLSNRKMGADAFVSILSDMEDDSVLKHLNLNYNMSIEETNMPHKMRKILRGIERLLLSNKTLTALDLAGNHLFFNSEHPSNEHLSNYVMDITDMLVKSNITHIDLSENEITGSRGRMLKGISHLMRNYVQKNCKAFKCRFSNLHSQGFSSVSQGLGIYSTLTYLDLSDNLGGIDPVGGKNSEGIEAFAGQLARSLHIRVLKLARNFLGDEDFILISNAMSSMPRLQILDLAGNNCHGVGAEALKDAIISHSTLNGHNEGIVDLNISGNPLGYHGIVQLIESILRSTTINYLKCAFCDIDAATMKLLQGALAKNAAIIYLDVSNNPVTPIQEALTLAEIEANRHLVTLRKDPISGVDASSLSRVVYSAVAKKLHYLSEDILSKLYENPSFCVPKSEMNESLRMLQPPGKKADFKKVMQKNDASSSILAQRLMESQIVEKRLKSTRLIFYATMRWYREFQTQKRLRMALEEAKAQQDSALNNDNDGDGMF